MNTIKSLVLLLIVIVAFVLLMVKHDNKYKKISIVLWFYVIVNSIFGIIDYFTNVNSI